MHAFNKYSWKPRSNGGLRKLSQSRIDGEVVNDKDTKINSVLSCKQPKKRIQAKMISSGTCSCPLSAQQGAGKWQATAINSQKSKTLQECKTARMSQF